MQSSGIKPHQGGASPGFALAVRKISEGHVALAPTGPAHEPCYIPLSPACTIWNRAFMQAGVAARTISNRWHQPNLSRATRRLQDRA